MKNKFFFVVSILILNFLIFSPCNAIELDELGSIDLHGYISQGFLQSNNNNFFANTEGGSFAIRETGLSISTDLTSRLRLGMQFLAYEMGDFGSNELMVNWANATWDYKKSISFKIGKMKLYHGLYNRGRDADFLRTSILLPQSVYNEAWRSTVAGISGAEIFGFMDAGVLGDFSYNLQAGKVEITPDSGTATSAKEELPERNSAITSFEPTDVDVDKTYTARLLWNTPVRGLNFNTTYYRVQFSMTGYAVYNSSLALPDEPAADFRTIAESLTNSMEFSVGNFLLVAEISKSKYGFKYMDQPEESLNTLGYYISGAYRFTDWFETGLYFADYDPNTKSGATFDPDHSGWLKDICLSTRFDIMDNWVIKFEGHSFNGTAVLMGSNNPKEDKKEDWLMFGTKITFSF